MVLDASGTGRYAFGDVNWHSQLYQNLLILAAFTNHLGNSQNASIGLYMQGTTAMAAAFTGPTSQGIRRCQPQS